MMTPRHAEIAFVLEGVAGVRRVYLLASSAGYDLAIEVDAVRVIPAAHYALLRVLSNQECGRVLYRHPPHADLPSHLMHRAKQLMLTMRERSDAQERVSPEFDLALPNRRRRLSVPTDAPFRALLVDVDEEVHDSLRWIVRGDSRHLIHHDQAAAVEVAFTQPFHVIVCGAAAALSMKGFLSSIAREDPKGAARTVVVAPARDVPYLKWNLERWHRKNPLIATPIDDTILRHEAFRDHNVLFAQIAAAEVPDGALVRRPRFRNLQVLIVDEDQSTEIFLAAAAHDQARHQKADVVHVKSAMDAFEHVVSREVDLVLCSATLRGDSGEPFYRVLWRLQPTLKARSVLIAPRDVIPASTSSTKKRVIERPLSHDAVARVIEDCTSR